MNTFWIVVADAGRAIILSRAGRAGATTVLHEMENPSGRLHTSEIASDRRGRVDKNGGHAQSAMEPSTDPHEQKAVNFAHELSSLVNDGAGRRAFDRLILIAPGHFLGLLQARLGKVAKKHLALCETKDLTHLSLAELEPRLDELVRLPGITATA